MTLLLLAACSTNPNVTPLDQEVGGKDTAAAATSTVSVSAIDALTLGAISSLTVSSPDASVTSADGSAVDLELPAGEPVTLRFSAPGYLDALIPVVPERESWELQLRLLASTAPAPFPSTDAYYAWEFGLTQDHGDAQIAMVARTRDNLVYSNTFVNFQDVAFSISAAYDDIGVLDVSADDGTETNAQPEYGWVTFLNTTPGTVELTATPPAGVTCYAPGAENPLEGPLTVDVAADEIVEAYVDCQYTYPQTCYEVLADDPSTTDGRQTLYVDHDGSMPWTAWCEDMSSGDPAEYLQFSRSRGIRNYSQYVAHPSQGTTVTTTYRGVRIDPETLTVDTSDQTFSTSTGSLVHGSDTVTSMPYAVAMSCDYASLSGSARIDLRGTPFAVNDTFVDEYDATVTPWTSSDGKLVHLRGGGACGWAQPAPGTFNPYNQAGTTLELSWVGL